MELDNNTNSITNINSNLEPKPMAPKPSMDISPEVQNVGSRINMQARVASRMPSSQYATPSGTAALNALNLSNRDNRIQTTKYDVGKDAFVQLNNGDLIPRFESYIPGTNNEEFLAQQQSTGEKWGNGTLKLLGKTGTNVIGNLIAFPESIIEMVRMQSISAGVNSDLNLYLDDLNTKMDYSLPNYYTEAEKDMNFGQQLGTANFYADKLFGGISFLAGAIVSEGVWAAATGGGSLIARGIVGATTRGAAKAMGAKRAMKAIATKKGPIKQLIRDSAKLSVKDLRRAGIQGQKIAKGVTTARFMMTSAGFEAGVEARQYMKEATEQWEQQFVDQYGRAPTGIEVSAFKNTLTTSANALFGANMALVGASNLAIIGKLFLNKAPSRNISNSIFKKNFLGIGYKKVKDGGVKAISANKYQKAFGRVYGIGKPIFTEGVIEEGGQAVLSGAATDYVLSAYDKDNVNDSLSVGDAMIKSLAHTFTSKEGLTEVGIGAIIGLFGGAISTGFKFNEVSGERKRVDKTVEFVNQFSTTGALIENIKYTSKLRQSTIDSEKARAEGNVTNEMQADMAAMAAAAERAYYFEDKNETIKDFNTAIDSIEDSTMMEEYGLEESEVGEWKAAKKAQFQEVVEEHTLNLQYAEAIVGDTPIAGLEDIEGLDESGMSDLKAAIAYTLTMGMQSDKFAEGLANQIVMNISKELGIDENTDAITVNEVLRKVGAEKWAAYKKASGRLKNTQYALDRLTKSKLEAETYAQSLTDVEARQKATARAAELQQQIIELEAERANLASEKTLAYNALNIQQFSEEVVTEDMLDEQAEKVQRLKGTIEDIATRDPRRAELLQKLTIEYERAINSAKSFNNLVNALVNPKTRVSTLSGWLGKIVNKKKSVKGDTAELFKNLIQEYQSNVGYGNNSALFKQRQEIEKGKIIDQLVKLDPNLNRTELEGRSLEQLLDTLKNIGQDETKDPTKVEAEDITAEEVGNTSTETPLQDVKKTIEQLKARIKDLITRNAYTNLVYEGSAFDFEGAKPNQKDMDRYTELLKKFTGKNINVMLKRPFNAKNPRGLTEAETNEVQALNNKLNNWKILAGLNDSNNDSVADMLQIINQLETDYQLTPTKIDIPTTELPTSDEVEGRMSANPLNTVVSPDVVMAKKDKKTKSYQFSHLKPTGLLNLFKGAKLYLVKGNKNVDVNSIPKKDLADAQVTKGNKFVLTTAEGKDLVFEVVDRQRLSVSEEALEEALNTDDTTKIVPYGRSNFMVVYTKAGEEYIPLQGDFVEASINDNEVIVLDSQRMNELEEGTPLRTVINLNETFNAKLIQDFKDGKITREELVNNIKIYLSPEGSVNKPVGFLRAILEDSTTNSDVYARLHLIRQQAVTEALRAKTPRVEVGITIPFKRTIPGAPNMNVKMQDGKLVAAGTSITQEALDAVEDYGYVLNGVPHTKNGLSLDNKEVITIFATALSNRAENRNVKVPIVIFEHKGKKYAFPVALKDRGGNKATQVLSILNNTEDSDLAKVVKLNELLLENNIDPRKYNITSLESPQVMAVLELFTRNEEGTQLRDVVDVETWLDENHNKTTLLNSVEIGIDITDKPFHSPKGILDLQNMRVPTEDDMRIAAVENLEKLGREVNSMFAKDNPFAEMVDNSEFYDAWEEVGIDGKVEDEADKQVYNFKVANANIVIDAFSKNIPRDVRRVLGNEKIAEIKAAIKEFQLIKNGLKPTITFVNQEGSEAIQEQENKCNG